MRIVDTPLPLATFRLRQAGSGLCPAVVSNYRTSPFSSRALPGTQQALPAAEAACHAPCGARVEPTDFAAEAIVSLNITVIKNIWLPKWKNTTIAIVKLAV